jgi:hypothetical protein
LYIAIGSFTITHAAKRVCRVLGRKYLGTLGIINKIIIIAWTTSPLHLNTSFLLIRARYVYVTLPYGSRVGADSIALTEGIIHSFNLPHMHMHMPRYPLLETTLIK